MTRRSAFITLLKSTTYRNNKLVVVWIASQNINKHILIFLMSEDYSSNSSSIVVVNVRFGGALMYACGQFCANLHVYAKVV